MRTLLAVAALLLCGVSHAATLYLTEFKPGSPVTYQAANTPPLAQQVVAVAGASAQSAAFQWNTGLIRVVCDVICDVLVGGTNPVATTSMMRLSVGVPEYFQVTPGDKLAVIAGS